MFTKTATLTMAMLALCATTTLAQKLDEGALHLEIRAAAGLPDLFCFAEAGGGVKIQLRGLPHVSVVSLDACNPLDVGGLGEFDDRAAVNLLTMAHATRGDDLSLGGQLPAWMNGMTLSIRARAVDGKKVYTSQVVTLIVAEHQEPTRSYGDDTPQDGAGQPTKNQPSKGVGLTTRQRPGGATIQ